MHSTSGGGPADGDLEAGDQETTVAAVTAVVVGRSPSMAVINHSWFSSLKRPLKKKFFAGKTQGKEAAMRAEYANQHQYYSWSSRKARSTWDISSATSHLVSVWPESSHSELRSSRRNCSRLML